MQHTGVSFTLTGSGGSSAADVVDVVVEGGATAHQSFLEEGLVDELVLFVAPKLFGDSGLTWSGALGIQDPAKALQFDAIDAVRVGTDLMVTARRRKEGEGWPKLDSHLRRRMAPLLPTSHIDPPLAHITPGSLGSRKGGI